MSNLTTISIAILFLLLGMTNILQMKELRDLKHHVDELEEKANKLPDDLK